MLKCLTINFVRSVFGIQCLANVCVLLELLHISLQHNHKLQGILLGIFRLRCEVFVPVTGTKKKKKKNPALGRIYFSKDREAGQS